MKKFTQLFLALVVVISMTTPAIAHGKQADKPSEHLDIKLQDDGDADFTFVLVYNLSSDEEKKAFKEIDADKYAQQLVNQINDSTGAKLSNINGDKEVTNNYGVVKLSYTWKGFGVKKEEKLLVVNRLQGFTYDNPIHLHIPQDGETNYRVVSTNPSATYNASYPVKKLTWDKGKYPEGLSVTLKQADKTRTVTQPDNNETTGSTPGFGIGIMVVSLVGAVLLYIRQNK